MNPAARSPLRLVLALVLLLSACSGGSPESTSTTSTSTTAPTSSAPATSQTPGSSAVPDSSLQVAVDDWLAVTQTVGAVVLVVTADGESEAVAAGWADRESKKPLTSDALFRVGSITKLYTASLAMDLVEAGLLALEDSAADHIPGLPEEITVTQLLDHTSGLRDIDVAAGIFEALEAGGEIGETDDAVLESLAEGLAFTPGSRQSYSSVGYLAVGRLIESISGRAYGDTLQERILQPLGLSQTSLETSTLVLPTPYERLGPGSPAISLGSFPTTEFAQGAGAAGALVAPASEVADFVRALFDDAVVSAESLALMLDLTAPRRDYGLGISAYATSAGMMFGHNGRTIGFASSVRHDPASGQTVVVLSNDGGAPTDDLAERLLAVMMGAG